MNRRNFLSSLAAIPFLGGALACVSTKKQQSKVVESQEFNDAYQRSLRGNFEPLKQLLARHGIQWDETPFQHA